MSDNGTDLPSDDIPLEGDPGAADELLESKSSEALPKSKAKRGKKKFILLAIACVIVAAGIGIYIWHGQPSFCNAICHSPMDTYVNSYYSHDDSMLVTAHAEQGIACLDCHEAKIDEQVTEGTKWITHDYKEPLNPMEYSDSFCLNESCHNITRDQLSEMTADLPWNPHSNRHGDVPCSMCHQMHGQSTLYCAQCHDEAAEFAQEIGWNYEQES